MINKNQYEKSALFIKDNIPVFVRKTYLSFVNMFDELISQYTKVSEKNAYTVNKVCERIISKKQFMYAYSFLFSHRLYAQKLFEVKTNTETRARDKYAIGSNITPDEQFYTVNGPDIYAPVESISTAITPFAYSFNTANRGSTPECRPAVNLEFEIIHADNLISGYNRYRKPEDYWSGDLNGITGIEGNPTVFDSLSSGCIVDVATLFDYYFDIALKNFDGTKSADAVANEDAIKFGNDGDRAVNSEANSLNWLIEFNKKLKSTEVTDTKITESIITEATNYLTSAAMATYFIFAAKLRGAKNDIYSWAYTAFVKDSVSHFDKAYYPTNAPVTIASGHGVKEDYHNDNSKDDPIYNTIDQNAAWDYAGGDGTNLSNVKMLIYRSIRLQYSTWASCINAIFGQAYRWTANDNNITSSSSSLKNYNTETTATLNFVQQALMEYLRARYRTYNLDTQLDLRGMPYQGISSIKSAVNAVKDISAAKAIRESIEGQDVRNVLNGCEEEAMKILSLNQTAITDLSRVFLYGSYLYMLAGLHAHAGNIYDEIETTTGKTKEQLFEEIYYGILNTLHEFISTVNAVDRSEELVFNVFTKDEADLIKESSKYLTNLRPDWNQNRYWEDIDNGYGDTHGNDEIQTLRDLKMYNADLNEIVSEELAKLSKSGNEKFVCDNVLGLIADIPLLTEFNNLKQTNFNSLKMQSTGYELSKAIGFKENGEAFPKNKVVIEAIDRFNANPKIRFKSLESLDSAVSTLESMTDLAGTEEGADAMANNSCYSAFGGIGGGICSLEITNSEDTVNDNLTAEPYAATKKINNLTPTDGDDNLIPSGTSDTVDQLQLTKGTSAESAKIDLENRLKRDVSERYNKLFNKYILGIK